MEFSVERSTLALCRRDPGTGPGWVVPINGLLRLASANSGRGDRRLTIASADRTPGQVPHGPHAEARGQFLQPVSTGGEEAAE